VKAHLEEFNLRIVQFRERVGKRAGAELSILRNEKIRNHHKPADCKERVKRQLSEEIERLAESQSPGEVAANGRKFLRGKR